MSFMCANSGDAAKPTGEAALSPATGSAKHPEAICDDCGGANVVWHAPSELWNKVCRPHGEIGADPMLCPTCFIARLQRFWIHEAFGPQSEINRLNDALKRILTFPVHSEPVGAAYAMQAIAAVAISAPFRSPTL